MDNGSVPIDRVDNGTAGSAGNGQDLDCQSHDIVNTIPRDRFDNTRSKIFPALLRVPFNQHMAKVTYHLSGKPDLSRRRAVQQCHDFLAPRPVLPEIDLDPFVGGEV